MAEEQKSPTAASGFEINYNDKTSLWYVLKTRHVQLIKPEFFVSLYEEGQRMPKCQDVPSEFILDVDDPELDWERLEIAVVSYCWISRDHPDPSGYHLETLASLCRFFLQGSFENAQESYVTEDYYMTRDVLRKQGYCFGSGDGRPVGVFLDWMSVPQDKPQGSRTTDETSRFEKALTNINIWYAHNHTITWRLTTLPEGLSRPGYEESGWTTFEKCVSGLVSKQSNLLHIDETAREAVLNGMHIFLGHEVPLEDYMTVTLLFMDRQRGAPMTPEAFNVSIDDKAFTNGADKYRVVIPKYCETFMAVITDAEELKFSCMGLDDEAAREIITLVETLGIREIPGGGVRSLELRANFDVGVPLHEWAKLANLTELNLAWTRVSGDIKALQPLERLTYLNLENCHQVSGDIQALKSLEQLTSLDLAHCTKVSGDVQALQSLEMLTYLNLDGCDQVTGDIQAIKKALSRRVAALESSPPVSPVGCLAAWCPCL